MMLHAVEGCFPMMLSMSFVVQLHFAPRGIDCFKDFGGESALRFHSFGDLLAPPIAADL